MRLLPKPKDVYGDERASRIVAVTTAKCSGRGGVLWGLVFGATIAASASSYASLFPTRSSRIATAKLVQGNLGFAALFGPLRHLDTVAGYTAYKSLYFVVVLGNCTLAARSGGRFTLTRQLVEAHLAGDAEPQAHAHEPRSQELAPEQMRNQKLEPSALDRHFPVPDWRDPDPRHRRRLRRKRVRPVIAGVRRLS